MYIYSGGPAIVHRCVQRFSLHYKAGICTNLKNEEFHFMVWRSRFAGLYRVRKDQIITDRGRRKQSGDEE